MKIQTKDCGEVEIKEEQFVTIEGGLFGFPGIEKFCILPYKDGSPFHWLQAVEIPDLAFLTIPPEMFHKDYQLKVSQDDLNRLELKNPEAAAVFAIIVVPEDPKKMTANLQGPVIVNPSSRRGKQCISNDPEHRLRHFVMEELSEKNR